MKTRQEQVWKALADPTRRRILDLLAARSHNTGEICGHFRRLTRFGIMKHLAVLEKAGLVLTRRDGRFNWHFFNAVPIRKIYERWVSKYVGDLSHTLIELKNFSEDQKH
ncbi:MAG: ArsR/SmtB family transcription factor [Candidatus Zixiibacteriota bacterium]